MKLAYVGDPMCSWRGKALSTIRNRCAVPWSQRAFYAEGRDTTDGRELAAIGAAELQRQGQEVSAAGFFYTWREPATIAETHADFTRTRKLGVSSFPSLLLDTGDGMREVSPGYANAEQLERLLGDALAAA